MASKGATPRGTTCAPPPDNLWQSDTSHKERRTIHTTKSREVDAALEAYKAELNSGTYVQKSRDTVGSYAKKFHDNREGTITPLAYSTSYSIENRTRTSHT